MTMYDGKGNLDDSYMSKSNRGDNCDVSAVHFKFSQVVKREKASAQA